MLDDIHAEKRVSQPCSLAITLCEVHNDDIKWIECYSSKQCNTPTFPQCQVLNMKHPHLTNTHARFVETVWDVLQIYSYPEHMSVFSRTTSDLKDACTSLNPCAYTCSAYILYLLLPEPKCGGPTQFFVARLGKWRASINRTLSSGTNLVVRLVYSL